MIWAGDPGQETPKNQTVIEAMRADVVSRNKIGRSATILESGPRNSLGQNKPYKLEHRCLAYLVATRPEAQQSISTFLFLCFLAENSHANLSSTETLPIPDSHPPLIKDV